MMTYDNGPTVLVTRLSQFYHKDFLYSVSFVTIIVFAAKIFLVQSHDKQTGFESLYFFAVKTQCTTKTGKTYVEL